MQTQNQFEIILTQSIQWIKQNQERFWAITGALLLSILFMGLVIHHRQTENEEAWLQLGSIQGQLMQGKFAETRAGLETWKTRFQGTDAGTYADFMKADLLYRTSDYVQASQVYGTIYNSGRPDVVRPLALSAQASSEEMAGHLSQAQSLIQTFLEKYPDHFLAGSNYMSQARLAELSGNPAAAVAVYERFVLLYPQSPWTALARSRSQLLGNSSHQNSPQIK